MSRISTARGSWAAAEQGPRGPTWIRFLTVSCVLLACWTAHPARAAAGPPPTLEEPEGLPEAPLGVVAETPSAACLWEGREGEPPLPVIVPIDGAHLGEAGYLAPALDCAESRRLEIVARIVPPTDWQDAPDPYSTVSPWLSRLEAFLRSDGEGLRTIELTPGAGSGLRPLAWTFLLEKSGSLLRSFHRSAALVAGPFRGSDLEWLRKVPPARVRPYINAVSVEGIADPASAIKMVSDIYAALPVWIQLDGGADPGDLLSRLHAARAAGAETVLLPPGLAGAARGAAAAWIRLVPSRYVPDPAPTGITIDGPEGTLPSGRWADTLGPERVAVFSVPPRTGALELTFQGEPIRTLKAFDLSDGKEMSGRLKAGGNGAGSALVLQPAAGPVLIRFVAGTEPRAEPETVGVTASVELTAPEIIARLRSVEERQRRAMDHFTATAKLSYHYRAEALNESIDVTSVNRFYWKGGVGDYEELELYINGARWRGPAPSLPFIQAEKVTDVPIAVRLDPSYGYRLVGKEKVDGHPVYVIDFDPVRSGDALYSGRVWIDADSFVRRRIRLVQQGLKAPITSNEDVIDYGPAPGGGEDHWVPLHAYRQMVFTVLGRTVAVERTVSYGDFHVNGPDFELRRKMAYSSGNRIARDDNNGFAYLTGEPGGVQTQQTSSLRNVAIVSGVTLGFSPAVSSPGAGLNYFDFDWRGTGTQVDIAWAGPFLDGTWTNPSLGGSRWELSTEGRFLGVRQKLKRTTDNGGRGEEALSVLDESTFFTLAHPLGERMKAELQLQLSRDEFNAADTASRRLIVPADLITETALGRWRYNRAGVGVELWGSYSHRPNWADWGLPPGPAGQPAGSRGQAGDTTYKRWGATLAKSWYPGGLQKVGLSFSVDAGSGMDRFSRFRVGDFQSVRVHGFNGSDITFDRGISAQLAYQFTIPQTGMSLLMNLDGALMENKEDFLSNPADQGVPNPSYREYIVGAGLGVAFKGPWGTLINVSTGFRVANSLTLDATGTSFHIVMVKTFGDWPWKKNPVEGGTMPGGVGSGAAKVPGDSGSGR